MASHPLFTEDHEALRQSIRTFVEKDFPNWVFERMGRLPPAAWRPRLHEEHWVQRAWCDSRLARIGAGADEVMLHYIAKGMNL